MARDPVCGMYVEENENAIKIFKNGRIYYFCSESCKEQFEKPEKEYIRLLKLLQLSWIITIPVIFFTYFPIFSYSDYILFILATINQFYPGLRYYKGAIDALKNRVGNMDLLIALGTTMAWSYSTITLFFKTFNSKSLYFDISSVIISLILTGTFLENKMKRKASEALEKLISLQPKNAHLIHDNTVIDVPVENIKINDLIIIKQGERIPVDGIIVEGISEVDESMMTGESFPITKKTGDRILAGTLNISSVLKVKVEKVGNDTTLSEIVQIVENASTERVPIQRIADRISMYFIPLVIFAGIISFLIWYFIGKIGLTFSLLIFVSVIIIACPCAMGIATPAALIVSSGISASNGIIFKNGESIEKSNKIDTVILDKTGTITMGEPEVKEIISTDSFSQDFIIRIAAIAESQSSHPFARAIMKKVKGENIEFPDDFEYFPGQGIKAIYKGNKIMIGNMEILKNENIEFKMNSYLSKSVENGYSYLFVVYNSKVIGIILISDTIRENSYEAINELFKMGMDVWMVTGDNQYVANNIAEKLSIKNVISNVKPPEKAKIVEKLKKEGKNVAFVGDGINDSPALVSADLGIVVGSGADIAKEAGDVILLKNNLMDLIKVFKIGKKTMKKIKQNLFWAFVYNSTLIPIAGGLLIPFFGPEIYNIIPFFAALAMAFSSTTVVTNSLLLRRMKL
ncbi:MAG: heavy metal translocating P-type ATPase [Thermoplasmata archaeon]